MRARLRSRICHGGRPRRASAICGHARPRRAAAILLTLALVGVLSGCGGGIELPDLFIVYRSGSVAGANLSLLVNEGGTVKCNRGKASSLSDPQLVQARAIQEELHDSAAKHLSLPPRRGSVLSYYVRDQDGIVHFSDNSAGQPKVLHQLALFVLQVSQGLCHLPI